MKVFRTVLIGMVVCVAIATGKAAHAANDGDREEGVEYGMAGCGLGSLIIHQNSTGGQLGVFLFNQIYANQSFAISSGTSNCVESRTETAAVEQRIYVKANLASLTREAAQGGGLQMDGLAEVFGCHGDIERQRLAVVSRENFAAIFAEQIPDHVVDQYLTVIRGDSLLAGHCAKAS